MKSYFNVFIKVFFCNLLICSLLFISLVQAENQKNFISKDNNKRITLGIGYSEGYNYNSIIYSAIYNTPNYLTLGICGLKFNFQFDNIVTSNYLIYAFAGRKVYERAKLSTIINGALISLKEEYTYINEFSSTLGLGIETRYNLKKDFEILFNCVLAVFTNGYTIPFHIGLSYNTGNSNIFLGVQGINSSVLYEKNTITNVNTGIIFYNGIEF